MTLRIALHRIAGLQKTLMRSIRISLLNFLLIMSMLVFSSLSAKAGWLIIEQQEDGLGNFGSQTIFIEGQLLRIETARSVFVIDMENETITLIFPEHQLFWTGHPDSLRQAISNRLQQQVEQLMAQMPPSIREENDSSFAAQLARFRAGEFESDSLNPIQMIQLNSSDSLLKYPTEISEFYADSILLERVWTTKAVNPYTDIDKQKLIRMIALFNPPSRVSAHRNYQQYQSLASEQFILKSLIPTPFGASVSEVVQLNNSTIPLSLFQPADDYQPAMLERIIEITMGEDKNNSTNPFKNPQQKPDVKKPFPELPPKPY